MYRARVLVTSVCVLIGTHWPPSAIANDYGDADGNGYIDGRDYRALATCLEQGGPGLSISDSNCLSRFDLAGDGDVDLDDVARLQRITGHLPITLRDSLGVPLTACSKRPYSGRQTCGSGCHDIDYIANGLHFQEGRTDSAGNIAVYEDFLGDGRWWIRAGGKYGKWRPSTNRQLASKTSPHASRVDYGSFGWIASCSGCHAGGGMGEFDRDGLRYFDEVTGLFGYQQLSPVPDVSLDGDYLIHQAGPTGAALSHAPWDQTGLSEPDCLLCHRADRKVDGVDAIRSRRASILGKKTTLVDSEGAPVPAYSAAATAGQGWYSVLDLSGEGPPVLQIDYTVGIANGSLLSNVDSTLSLAPTSLASIPTDRVCFGCHQGGAAMKRGATWFDTRSVHYAGLNMLRDEDPTNDVDPDASTACSYCHPGGLHHNFAKGNAMSLWFRDDLDWQNMRSCRDCHLTDSPNRHPRAPHVPGDAAVHLVGGKMEAALSCQVCHIPYALLPARALADQSLTGAGKRYETYDFYSADPLDPTDSDKQTWYPALGRKQDSDGEFRYFPYNPTITAWWADWHQNGTPNDYSDDLIEPILPWRVQQATGGEALPIVSDDNGDGRMEVNTSAEILAYITALRGNDSYGRPIAANPVLVKGGRLWYQAPGSASEIVSLEYAPLGIVAEPETKYEMDHNVLAANLSWGFDDPANPEDGCNHCHRTDNRSPVLDRKILLDPWSEDGPPVYVTVREMTGLSPP